MGFSFKRCENDGERLVAMEGQYYRKNERSQKYFSSLPTATLNIVNNKKHHKNVKDADLSPHLFTIVPLTVPSSLLSCSSAATAVVRQLVLRMDRPDQIGSLTKVPDNIRFKNDKQFRQTSQKESKWRQVSQAFVAVLNTYRAGLDSQTQLVLVQ